MANIIIFGDSVARGANDYEKQGRVNRLREKIEQETTYTEVYNCGISGDTSESVRKRFLTEAQVRSRTDDKKLFIIFAIGINDSAFLHTTGKNNIPPEYFQRNLELLIQQAKTLTEQLFFVGLTPVDEEKVNPLPRDNTVSYYNEYIQNYDNQLHAICIEKGIPFISLQEIIKKADLEDGLHPNTQGHQKMCEVICKVIHR